MKILLISVLIFLNYSKIYSQDINYISVFPKYNSEVTGNDKFAYDNLCVFEFFLNTVEMYQSKNCFIDFSFDELGEYGVAAITGWEGEYTEAREYYEITSMDSSYSNLSISTNNLPKLMIYIGYNGQKRKIRILDVSISFRGSRF